MDRDKSAFKSHRILALRKRLPLNAFRVNFSYLFVTEYSTYSEPHRPALRATHSIIWSHTIH